MLNTKYRHQSIVLYLLDVYDGPITVVITTARWCAVNIVVFVKNLDVYYCIFVKFMY